MRPSDAPGVIDPSPPLIASLRDKCWHREPLQRPSFSAVLGLLDTIQTPGDISPYGTPISHKFVKVVLNSNQFFLDSSPGRSHLMSHSGSIHAYGQFSQAPPSHNDRGSLSEWHFRQRTLNDLLRSRWVA